MSLFFLQKRIGFCHLAKSSWAMPTKASGKEKVKVRDSKTLRPQDMIRFYEEPPTRRGSMAAAVEIFANRQKASRRGLCFNRSIPPPASQAVWLIRKSSFRQRAKISRTVVLEFSQRHCAFIPARSAGYRKVPRDFSSYAATAAFNR